MLSLDFVSYSVVRPKEKGERNMGLPTAYMTSTKRVPDILEAMKTAQAPDKFSQRFLESLGFKAKGDRLIINVLKSLGFLDDAGKPGERYFEYLDQTQSDRVLADGIRDAYSDLFAVNINANQMTKASVVNKFRTLSQGKLSDPVLNMSAMTFLALCKLGDFEAATPPPTKDEDETEENTNVDEAFTGQDVRQVAGHTKLGGLVYSIQIVLPETRDIAVYDALFKSLKDHIL